MVAAARVVGAGGSVVSGLHLYDTARRSVVEVEPGPVASMYVCGITPYDSTHLGHARTYLTHDLIARRLDSLGHEVRMVRNVTDVDDSILPKARELGIDFRDLARTEMDRFHGDMIAMEMWPLHAEPWATGSIDSMTTLLSELVDGGHTYTIDGTTWFDVSTFERFGDLSGFTTDEMIEIARERGGTPDDPRQRQPLDFVLWLPSADDEPEWDSPVGPGRPGWHLECSAMSAAAVDLPLDIHGGGDDLVFPHHECEIAQSEALGSVPFAKHWVHGGMVGYEGTKMSKSLGNLVFVSELRRTGDARAIRLALMEHPYREAFEWFDHEFGTAMTLLDGLIDAVGGAPSQPGVLHASIGEALDDDLDTPTIMSLLKSAPERVAAAAVQPSDVAAGLELLGIDPRRGVHRAD